jgi:hypothetical protein
MNERLAKAEALFHKACEVAPQQREAFLRQACGEDVEVLNEVRVSRTAGSKTAIVPPRHSRMVHRAWIVSEKVRAPW